MNNSRIDLQNMTKTQHLLCILDLVIKEWVNRDKSLIMHDNIHCETLIKIKLCH